VFFSLLEQGAEISKEIVQVGEVCLVWAEEGLCKGTPPFLPLNGMATLQSYLSVRGPPIHDSGAHCLLT